VLGRIGDDRILVAAAWLTILIATTAMMASAMRSDAVARSAILQVLRDAPAGAAGLQVAVAAHAEDADQTDAIVRREIALALGSASGTTWASATSDGYRLAGRDERDVLVFGFAEGLADHARIVDGDWPPAQAEPDGTIVTAVSSAAAAQLGLELGSRLTVEGRGVDGVAVPLRVGGIYEPIDATDPYWWADALALEGQLTERGFTTIGPLIVDRSLVFGRLTDIWSAMRWRTLPDGTAIDPGNVGSVAGGVRDLARRISTDLGRKDAAEVTTDLPAILSRATSGTRSSGSGILLLDGQIIVLGGYALIMVAAMVVERRRGTTAVLRVRGATTGQLLRLSATEALVLVVPAALLAPALAAGLLIALDALGSGGHVVVVPRVTVEAIVLAAIAAGVAFVGMAIPVLASSGPIASVRRSVGRQLTRTAAHRTGLDVAFVAFAAVLLWELRVNGAPISQSFRGSIGIDPLLVAAPAMGLAAGAVLTMRIVPALAVGLERLAGRRNGVVGPLAARSISRRSSRYSRSALLLVVAVAIAFLAATYQRTWQQSQVDQVATAIPVDLVAAPAEADPRPGMAEARVSYISIDAVDEAGPVVQQAFDLRLPNGAGRGSLIAIVPELSADHVELRSDLAKEPFADQLRSLVEARPALSVVPLPPDAARLRVTVETDIAATPAGHSSIVPTTGPLALGVTAIVRDAAGLLYRASSTGTVGQGERMAEIPLEPAPADGAAAAPGAPLELVALELTTTIPPGTVARGSASVTDLEAAAVGADASTAVSDWSPIGWAATSPTWTWAKVLVPRMDPDGTVTNGPPATVRLPTDRPPSGLDEMTLTVGPRELAGLSDIALPTLADQRLVSLAAPGGDGAIAVTQGFADIRRLDVVGQVALAPTVDPTRPAAIVDLPTMQLSEFVRTGTLLPADGWWLSLAGDADPATVAADLAAASYPLRTTAVRADAIAARARDPFQAGVTSILALAAGAALLFALIGLFVSLWYTVSSRQGEFAVARALGLGRRQLVGWLALESGFLVVVGVIGGLLVGLVLAWVVMPSITLTTEGRAPVPPPVTAIAWDLVVVLAGLGLLAFALSVLAARRAVASVRVAATLRITEADR
jgi:FtsX-like permease family